MRTFVLGDVHGAARALEQVLERSAFDRESDRLVFLGDVADGWPETRDAIDLLLSIPNLVALLGNHDVWLRDWASGTFDPFDQHLWLKQGGYATLDSYEASFWRLEDCDFPGEHVDYLRNARLYFEEEERLFVHAGFTLGVPIKIQDESVLTWTRGLWSVAVREERAATRSGKRAPNLTDYDEVFVGHTSVTSLGTDEPVRACEIWNLDTGAGWEGRLSIMDVETKEFWQSDPVCELYPEYGGRMR